MNICSSTVPVPLLDSVKSLQSNEKLTHEPVHKAFAESDLFAKTWSLTNILSSDHLARHEPKLADLLRDSSLPAISQVLRIDHTFLPGSKRTNLLAPIKFSPQPPAFEESRKMNSLPSGSLNLSTNWPRFLMLMEPSRRSAPHLRSLSDSHYGK